MNSINLLVCIRKRTRSLNLDYLNTRKLYLPYNISNDSLSSEFHSKCLNSLSKRDDKMFKMLQQLDYFEAST